MIGDRTLLKLIRARKVTISPLNLEDVQPVSYDVHLGSNGLVFPEGPYPSIDLLDGPPIMDKVYIPKRNETPMYLNPGGFLLGEVFENLRLDADIAVKMDGKSTLGRIGLFVHVTAGLVDPGWGLVGPDSGHLTVELFNASPRRIRLWAGMPIGQLEFHILSEPVARPYGHKDLRNHYSVSHTVRGSAGFGGEPCGQQ